MEIYFFEEKQNYEYSSNMQIRSFQLIIYIGKSNCSFCWHFLKSYIYRSHLHQILTLNSKYFCNANKIWRWKLLGSPLQLFPHMFYKLFRKTEQMIRICRLSTTSQYSFFFLNVRFEDLWLFSEKPFNSIGHNIPQGLNFREKQSLVTPIQLWLPWV